MKAVEFTIQQVSNGAETLTSSSELRMIAKRVRHALLALIFLLVPASQADAFEWLDRMLGIGNTSYYGPTAVAPTTVGPAYAPTTVGPAYAPTTVGPAYALTAVVPACCRQQTCYSQPTTNYIPQTCYRTVYQLVPVTTYCPTSMCDPCTGCPGTVMRPVTSFVMQASVVPYASP